MFAVFLILIVTGISVHQFAFEGRRYVHMLPFANKIGYKLTRAHEQFVSIPIIGLVVLLAELHQVAGLEDFVHGAIHQPPGRD